MTPTIATILDRCRLAGIGKQDLAALMALAGEVEYLRGELVTLSPDQPLSAVPCSVSGTPEGD